AGIVHIEPHQLQHVAAGDPRVVRGRGTENGQQRSAGGILVDPRVLEHAGAEGVEDPGRVVGPLDVPADPEQGFGDPAEHSRASHCCPDMAVPEASRVFTSCGMISGTGGMARGRGTAAASRANTQVSLEPPPWLEFTTRVPSGNA